MDRCLKSSYVSTQGRQQHSYCLPEGSSRWDKKVQLAGSWLGTYLCAVDHPLCDVWMNAKYPDRCTRQNFINQIEAKPPNFSKLCFQNLAMDKKSMTYHMYTVSVKLRAIDQSCTISQDMYILNYLNIS